MSLKNIFENAYFQTGFGCIINADCLEIMKEIEDNTINMVLCDLPYEETGNKWDKKLDIANVFREYERIITENGAVVLTGTFKFGTQLYKIAPHLYKYDWVWEKDNGTNAPNVNLQPFRIHEYVYVFGKGRVTNGKRTPMKYYPQKTEGKPYTQISGRMSENWKGSLGTVVTENRDGKRHPKTIQKFVRDKSGLHPTQKPVEMFEFFIRTYTDKYDIVLDNTAGSCTTGVAAENLGRRWLCIEKELKYCEAAKTRFANI